MHAWFVMLTNCLSLFFCRLFPCLLGLPFVYACYTFILACIVSTWYVLMLCIKVYKDKNVEVTNITNVYVKQVNIMDIQEGALQSIFYNLQRFITCHA